MLPDLVLSGLLVIGELLRVAAAGPEAAQARRTGMHTCTCMCPCACVACNDVLTWCLHGADVGAGGAALPAAWRAGGLLPGKGTRAERRRGRSAQELMEPPHSYHRRWVILYNMLSGVHEIRPPAGQISY